VIYFYNMLMNKYKLIVPAVMFLLAATAWGQPKLEASPSEFDFGFTVKDAAITTGLWLKSTGTDTVNISEIKTGCECTTIPLETKRIAPGDSIEVFIRWETERTFGQVKRYPRFYYDNAPHELRFGLKANVLNMHDSIGMAISVWPYRFEFGRHASISVDSMAFKLKNVLDGRIRPSLAGHVPEQCVFVLPEVIPAKGEAWGYIKIKNEYLDQEFDNSITLKFNHNDKYFITVPIRRKVYKSQMN